MPTLMALLMSVAGTSAYADCVFPKAPASIPDGRTATTEAMQTAATQFKAYNDAVTAYGVCLDGDTKSKSGTMGDGQVRQLKTIQMKKYNSAVEELQAKVEQFNAQVRAFKARGG